MYFTMETTIEILPFIKFALILVIGVTCHLCRFRDEETEEIDNF